MKMIKVKSGIGGQSTVWQAKLHEVFDFQEFDGYCAMYGIQSRLGYKTVMSAWRSNPVVQGSVNPSDLRRVR